jgi:hypothetical protein
VVAGSSVTLTIGFSNLIADADITDDFWSDMSNWSAVKVLFIDANDAQRKSLDFRSDASSDNFSPSVKANKNTWKLHSVMILDFDGGDYPITRDSIANVGDYDMVVS